MNSLGFRLHRSHRLAKLQAVLAIGCLSAACALSGAVFGRHQVARADTPAAFAASKTVTRTNLINGVDTPVESRTVAVTADVTQSLKDRQGVHISWSGAHPTGGVVYDNTSQYAVDQEYPVAILQCRGVDSATAPAAQQLTPETCYTQTPNQRYLPAIRGNFPPYRLDRYASAADRAYSVGAPDPLPDSCLFPNGADHWVHLLAADGTDYAGGYNGCGGLSPDQSSVINALNPPSTTFATTRTDGTGSADFIVQNAESNATLGCSDTVACAIVVIPIMGISCDPAATGLPAADQPPAVELADDTAACTSTGSFGAGLPGVQGNDFPSAMAVSGQLWWSASNWRNRITIPITMAQTAAVCEVSGGGTPENVYGSEYMLQLTQQWAPKFCLDPSLFSLQQVQTSEVQAKNLLANGVTNGQYLGVKAVYQAGPPAAAFSNPVVQAPTAVTGFGIAFVIDDAKQHQVTSLKLDARLLAKLLTMSYPAFTTISDAWSRLPKYQAQAKNPLDIVRDPEFRALNPAAVLPDTTINQVWASSTLFAMSSDSDVMSALTSYINADPDARAWLDGRPDPWGMVINPYYKGIKLPVTSWPLLDPTYVDIQNNCISDGKLPIMPLIAAPVSDPSIIAFNMQYGISNAQVNCVLPTGVDDANSRRLAGEGREQPGIRFLLGLVGLGDAARFQLPIAELETQKAAGAADKFTDDIGRSFVAPTDASLQSAVKLMDKDPTLNTWTMPYAKLRTDATAAGAYPGTLLMSTDVPTIGLTSTDAGNFAKLLNYAAGPGQTAGTANGDLPAGYLPLTADGLTEFVDFTKRAAAEVASQKGRVPLVNGGYSSLTTSSPAGGGGNSGGGSGAQTTGSNNGTSSDTGNGLSNPSSSPTSSGSSAPTAGGGASRPSALATAQVRLAGQTKSLGAGWLAFAIPALALLGLVSAAGSVWASGVGRR